MGPGGEPDPATLALLERCASPLLAAAAPRAVYLRASKEELDAPVAGGGCGTASGRLP